MLKISENLNSGYTVCHTKLGRLSCIWDMVFLTVCTFVLLHTVHFGNCSHLDIPQLCVKCTHTLEMVEIVSWQYAILNIVKDKRQKRDFTTTHIIQNKTPRNITDVRSLFVLVHVYCRCMCLYFDGKIIVIAIIIITCLFTLDYFMSHE